MSLIILIVLLAAYHHGAAGQSLCTTPTGATGTCKSILQCEPLLALVTNDQRTERDMFILRKSLCGYENNKPKVCCPKPCQTPDGRTGECINIYKCDELANRLRWPVTKQNMDIVVNYSCENEDNFGVCCPLPVEGNCGQRINAFPMDPRSQCCGVENVVSNKIVGGNATTLDQYPWLALIEYVKNEKVKTLCGSALISGKYVLTAKHCVTGDVLQLGTPTNIRLGEYDTSNDGKDCIAVDGGGRDCNEGVVIIPIETIIPYPGDDIRKNDIALIRMTQTARYTDFIRPICLPNVDYTSLPPAKFDMFVAGWGAVSTSMSNSIVKMHVRVPYVPLKACQETYCKRKTSLSEKQLCAGGESGKDSCKGDSGGPLMYNSGRTFEAIGIVSFGPLPCGSENVPGVYTNVFQYRDWIISKIKP